ncbi:hypothetical protein H1V43_26070 [Streptomyces sp. PSKA54]|uniref:Uncharacterized protein n=1 Tax=Streptomyces himalayensis subsp. aureolus TaxID=2758039 RepID=A0A7W2D4S6_9ACTN|nr:hypothetical protein [Streptomyces himalayensis]MBA4864756.1 hypothetical protein [Streptomyces himalayensis subsp. aureolus]
MTTGSSAPRARTTAAERLMPLLLPCDAARGGFSGRSTIRTPDGAQPHARPGERGARGHARVPAFMIPSRAPLSICTATLGASRSCC